MGPSDILPSLEYSETWLFATFRPNEMSGSGVLKHQRLLLRWFESWEHGGRGHHKEVQVCITVEDGCGLNHRGFGGCLDAF